MAKRILFSSVGSSCTWRVHIALMYKGIDYEVIGVSTRSEYIKHNPLGQVPVLIMNGNTLTQSVAIMEYLEEIYPNKSLLPESSILRAKVSEICGMIVSGIQPLQNPPVQQKYSTDEGKGEEWAKYWVTKGFAALELVLEKSSGKYCVGDNITMADCCLSPQVDKAIGFNVDMTQFPLISKINETLQHLEEFKYSNAFSKKR